MKKSLIALAVAGAFAAPAFAATSNVDVYGVINFSTDFVDVDDGVANTDDSDVVTGVSNASRVGFKGSEDLGGGMKAIWQVETQLGSTTFANRNSFIGLSGGFGTVLMGTHDTPYKLGTGSLDPFADTIGDYNAIIGATDLCANSGAACYDLRLGVGNKVPQGAIAYVTPTVSGFHAAIGYVQLQTNDATPNDDPSGWSLTGIYSNGPLFASLSYEQHQGGAPNSTATNDSDAWKLGVGYMFGDTKLGLVYESIDGPTAASNGTRDAWYLSLTHSMGPIVLKAAYGEAKDSDAAGAKDGAKLWAVGADYNLSKRTSVYAVYADLSNDTAGDYRLLSYDPGTGKDASGFSIGIKHSF